VASGAKTNTIRYDDPVAVGPALFVFEDDEDHRTLGGTVTAVEHYRLDQITPEQARLAPEASLAGLRQGLQRHYPDMPAEAQVAVVTFVLATD
jgi:cytidine deaminase